MSQTGTVGRIIKVSGSDVDGCGFDIGGGIGD
jgi:hypothetical protein